MTFMTVMLIATGGALAIEGGAWAIFPSQMREIYQQAFAAGDRLLHLSGLASVAIGMVLIMWAVKFSGA